MVWMYISSICIWLWYDVYMTVYLYMYMHMYIYMNMYAYMLLRSTTQYYVVIGLRSNRTRNVQRAPIYKSGWW